MITITTTIPRPFQIGDRIVVGDKSNRCRQIIGEVVDVYNFRIMEFNRPSKGFRRHIRRVKQEKRR